VPICPPKFQHAVNVGSNPDTRSGRLLLLLLLPLLPAVVLLLLLLLDCTTFSLHTGCLSPSIKCVKPILVGQLDTVKPNRYFSYRLHYSQQPVARIETRNRRENRLINHNGHCLQGRSLSAGPVLCCEGPVTVCRASTVL